MMVLVLTVSSGRYFSHDWLLEQGERKKCVMLNIVVYWLFLRVF
jgi:hypothetical protein